MIYFDTEDNSNGKVYLINFFDGTTHTTFDYKDYKNQRAFKRAAIKFILGCGEKIFFAHNLEYDIVNVFYPYSLKLLELVYSGRLIYAKMPGTHIKFKDSFNFSFTSLKNIGDEIGLPKMDAGDDFYNIEYCRRDCEIGYKFVNTFDEKVKFDYKQQLKMTLAGTSHNIFLKHFCPRKVTGMNRSEKLLDGYFGGRCEVFRLGEFHDPVFCVDVNSMYPHVMRNFKYPVTQGFITVEPITDFFISRVKIKIKKDTVYPLIPYRSDLLYFPVGEFETFITNVELYQAKKDGQIESIKFLETYNYIESDYVFSDFVDHFYNLRYAAKMAGKNFESNFYKRILNATYGRFALKSNMQVIKSEYEDGAQILKNDMFSIEKTFKKKAVNYALPIFVTSYSRIVLYNLFKKIESIGGKVIYSDTDSVYFHYHKKIDLQDTITNLYSQLPIDNHLGNLSLEVYAGGSFQGAKSYLLEKYSLGEKIKLKGIPTKHRKEYLTTGRTSYKRPMKLRPSMRGVQGIPANVWYTFYIERSGKYRKRLIDTNLKYYSTTKPVEIGA